MTSKEQYKVCYSAIRCGAPEWFQQMLAHQYPTAWQAALTVTA